MRAGGTRSGFSQSYSEPHLWLSVSFSSGVRGVDVEQSPPALTPQEGASSTLWCNFSTSADSVLWYLQKPGGRHLIYIPSGIRQGGRLNATTVLKERRSSLHVSFLRTTDSGTYFCAVQHCAPRAPAACTQTLRGAQPLLQPQSHCEATTGHLQCFLLALQIWDFGLYLPLNLYLLLR